jgi:hypothetical protein
VPLTPIAPAGTPEGLGEARCGGETAAAGLVAVIKDLAAEVKRCDLN